MAFDAEGSELEILFLAKSVLQSSQTVFAGLERRNPVPIPFSVPHLRQTVADYGQVETPQLYLPRAATLNQAGTWPGQMYGYDLTN